MAKTGVKKVLRWTAILLLAALVVIQFIRQPKNQTDAKDFPGDITKAYTVPDDIQKILAKACNDCHSDNTRYPWYNNIQPVAFWLNDHIKDGKRHVNFNEFTTYTLARQAKKLKKCAKEVEEGEMPLDSYLWIHKDAKLTDAEKKAFMDWANNLSAEIAAKAPPEPKKS